MPAYDFQYFLPQEFLSDLPLREGSFGAEVIQYLLMANPQDLHHEKVDSGWFYDVFADSDFNSPTYRSRRNVCVRVPVGSNPRGAPHMCEHENAQAPQAEILKAAGGEEIGRFMLSAEFEFSAPGHLKIESKTCCIVCWTDKVCDDDVTITGVLRVQSLVHVRNAQGSLQLQPETTVSWPAAPRVDGCDPDCLVRLFANWHSDLSDGVKDALQKYVEQNLQQGHVLPQTMSLHPELNLTYQLKDLQFVHSSTPSNQSYVIAHATCTVDARAANGSVQAFPDAAASWTGKHNALPMDDPWRRAVGTGSEQLVLLGGARFSEELLTMLARGMHYAGMLRPHNSSTVKDAHLYSSIDMSCPEVDISKERAGVVMRQDHLHLQIDCDDRMAGNATNFSLMNATFSNVLEEISISAYVPNDHTAGIVLQVLNVSMGSANVSTFHSPAFLGPGNELKALALHAMRKGLPLMNDQLSSTPIIFCSGGSSACALVPFAPHPAVSTSPRGKMKPGYVQLIWHCQCGSSDFYESCSGFQCPEMQLKTRLTRPLEVRQLHQLRRSAAESPASKRPTSTGAWVSLFSNQLCNFVSGESILFANVADETCAVSDHPPLAPAFRLRSYKHGWYLYSGCRSSNCSGCRLKRWIPLRRCTCLASSVSGPCIVLSSTTDGCVPCLHVLVLC